MQLLGTSATPRAARQDSLVVSEAVPVQARPRVDPVPSPAVFAARPHHPLLATHHFSRFDGRSAHGGRKREQDAKELHG